MNARDLGYIAVSTAFLCVSAWLSFPLGGIPFTMQIFVLCALSCLLGWKRGALSTLAYLLLLDLLDLLYSIGYLVTCKYLYLLHYRYFLLLCLVRSDISRCLALLKHILRSLIPSLCLSGFPWIRIRRLLYRRVSLL